MLSTSRVVLTPVFLWLFFSQGWQGHLLGLVVFTIASLTDVYNGRLARSREALTDLGGFLDPLADKILVCSALIALAARGLASSWMVAVIVIRELLITGLRIHAIHRDKPVVTSKLAKCKTITQLAAIFAILATRSLMEALVRFRLVSAASSYLWTTSAARVLVAATMLITAISGILYLVGNRHLYRRGFRPA